MAAVCGAAHAADESLLEAGLRRLKSKSIEQNMARREQAIVCPNCKKTGSAIWEDHENPVHLGLELGTALMSVSRGFRVGEGTKIFCTTCNIKVQT